MCLKMLALTDWRNETAVSVLLDTKVLVSVAVREWGVLFCQLNDSFCQLGDWVKIQAPFL